MPKNATNEMKKKTLIREVGCAHKKQLFLRPNNDPISYQLRYVGTKYFYLPQTIKT